MKTQTIAKVRYNFDGGVCEDTLVRKGRSYALITTFNGGEETTEIVSVESALDYLASFASTPEDQIVLNRHLMEARA